MADEEQKHGSDVNPPPGGEEGATGRNPNRLRRSELNVLRKMASRFPFTQQDRLSAVGAVNDAIASPKARERLAGIKCMVAMEKINLGEVALLISSQRVDEKPAPPAVTVNIAVLPTADLKTMYELRKKLIAGPGGNAGDDGRDGGDGDRPGDGTSGPAG